MIAPGARVAWTVFDHTFSGQVLGFLPRHVSLTEWERTYCSRPESIYGALPWSSWSRTDTARSDRYVVLGDEFCRTVSARKLERENP